MEHTERRKLRHDILGSLNSIKLSSEVIKTTQEREEILMFLGFIDKEVVRIETMVDQLAADPSKP